MIPPATRADRAPDAYIEVNQEHHVVQHASAGRSGGRRTTTRFKVGDRVSWNSEAGRVSGKIVKVHTKDVNYKGYVHHASKDEPQYEIKSDKTDHVALHKGGVLRLLRR